MCKHLLRFGLIFFAFRQGQWFHVACTGLITWVTRNIFGNVVDGKIASISITFFSYLLSHKDIVTVYSSSSFLLVTYYPVYN